MRPSDVVRDSSMRPQAGLVGMTASLRRGDPSTRTLRVLGQDDRVGAAEKLRVELAAGTVTEGTVLWSHSFQEQLQQGCPSVTLRCRGCVVEKVINYI